MLDVCGVCGRKLKSKESMDAGFGPVCLKKHKTVNNTKLDDFDLWVTEE